MPTKKTSVKQTRPVKSKKPDFYLEEEKKTAEVTPASFSEQKSNKKKPKYLFLLVLLIAVITVVGYFFRDKFIIAIVNGKPIFRFEVSQKLFSSFGKETLENIIVEKLIEEEAKKQSVLVSKEDLDKELDKVGKSLGNNMKLEDVLKFQGVSLDDFKKQLIIRLQVNRILEKKTTITPEELDKFLKDNAKLLVATVEAERKAEAQEKLKEQKINEQVQKWVNDLLAKAKVSRFLK